MKAPQYLLSFTSSPSNVLQRCFSRWFGYEAQGLSGNLNNRGGPALSPTTAFRLEAGSSEDGLFPPWEVRPPPALCLLRSAFIPSHQCPLVVARCRSCSLCNGLLARSISSIFWFALISFYYHRCSHAPVKSLIVLGRVSLYPSSLLWLA